MYLIQITRCLRLIYLLQTRLTRSTEEIAHEVGVSKRTVFRYYRVLEEAGIPIRYDAEVGGHLIDYHFNLKATQLSDNELTALLLAAKISSFTLGQEFTSAINQAIYKLLTNFPNHIREELVNFLKACVIDLPIQLPLVGDQEVYSAIVKAIRKKLKIRITYDSPEDGHIYRTKLSPYRLVASPEGWCVIGRSSMHREILRFEFQQIRHAELTDDIYCLPYRFRRCTPLSRVRLENHHELEFNTQMISLNKLSMKGVLAKNHQRYSAAGT